jgi:hypothetical protein
MPVDLSMTGHIAECKLDLDGLRRQRDRYRRLGLSAEAVERTGETLAIRFSADLSEALLRETLAVEADCCPFYRFDYSAPSRRLRIGVAESDQLPALDAIEYALRARLPAPLRNGASSG